MPDFVTFFPAIECTQPPAPFSGLNEIFSSLLHADHVKTEISCGAMILRTRFAERTPQLYVRDDEAGWIVVKGRIFDVRSESPEANLKELLELFLGGEDLSELNRYEGTFALAAWDRHNGRGWAVNDQTSTLNLYYGEHDGGLYVSTNAMSLAKVLRLGLDPYGVQELLARSALLAPTTMFEGLRRVDIGEHVRYRAGVVSRGRHWYAYEPEVNYSSLQEAAGTVSGMILDRVARYSAFDAASVLCDLTGGLDSRLVASAVHAADLNPSLTVNGPSAHEDVRIAYQVAEAMRWSVRHFDPQVLWTEEITPNMRRELVYRLSGELPFTEAYHHLLTRPGLAQDFGLHFTGSGGELLRYFPWSQEFFGIGRRQLANTNRVLDYRFLANTPSPSLFSQNWLPLLRSRLKERIESICGEREKTRTTQQLDAVYIWKMTSHSSLYASSLHNWLPTYAPLLSAGIVNTAIAMPWKIRLTSQLQSRVIHTLSPRTAGVVTMYGGTAEPISMRNVHLAAWQTAKRVAHLTRKLERVRRKDASQKTPSPGTSAAQPQIPFVTREFRELLAPQAMLSRRLYSTEHLLDVLGGHDQEWYARAALIVKLATVEQLCRELSFEPDEDFLHTSR